MASLRHRLRAMVIALGCLTALCTGSVRDAGAKVAKATGAKETWSPRGDMPTSHLHGGTIMGKDGGSSVVDSYGQSHDIPNLWIAGPGVFPTEGASNPTYSIFAVSRRGSDQLVSTWGSVAG